MKNKMIVMKFGGTSVANAEQMLNIIEIVKKQQGRKIIVLSACKGITDKLELLANYAKDRNKENVENIFNEIVEHHTNIIYNAVKDQNIINKALNIINDYTNKLNALLDGIYLLKELTPAVLDAIFSFGELLSSNVFHYICCDRQINSTWIDARELIITNSDFNEAVPIPNEYTKKLYDKINQIHSELIVTQGFIAADASEKTTTLGRGGSDFSAALIGAAVEAREIQIWTDVDGILTADPKKIKNTKNVKMMTFPEVKDLSFWGAKVLHPKTILPAIEKNISVKILNSFNLNSEGTTIRAKTDKCDFKINSIVLKEHCYLLNIKTDLLTTVNNYTSIYDYASISNLISFDEINKKISVLYFGHSNSIFTILFENLNKATYFIHNINSNKIIYSATVSVICLTGQNLYSNPDKFTKFIAAATECFGETQLRQLIYQYSDSSVVFVVEEDVSKNSNNINAIVEKIHRLILEQA